MSLTPQSDISRAVRLAGLRALASGDLSNLGVPVRIEPVAMWRDGRFGSVLFLAEPHTGLFPFESTSLNHEDAELVPIINR